MVKGLVQLLPVYSSHVQVIAEPITNHWVMWGVMATSTYGDLCLGSRPIEIVLRNLSAREVCFPPKTVIGNVQTAEQVPDWEMLSHTGEDLPPKKWGEPSKVGWTSGPNPSEKGVTQQNPQSPLSEFEVPTLEHNVLEKVDLLGYAEWDSEDHWEAQSILREYADVFTNDDLDLGWTSIVKHKITLEEGARPIKECYVSATRVVQWGLEAPPGNDMSELYDHPIVPGPVPLYWSGKEWQASFLHWPEEVELLDS